MAKAANSPQVADLLRAHAALCAHVIGVAPGQMALVVNHRVLGPAEQPPVVSDMRALEKKHFELGRSLQAIVKKFKPETVPEGTSVADVQSDLMMEIAGLLAEMSNDNRYMRRLAPNLLAGIKGKHAVLTLGDSAGAMQHDVTVVLDPLSKDAQVRRKK